MRSANSYQDIKTPEDYEYEGMVDTIYAELCDQYADEIEEHGMKPADRAAFMKRAREIARERMREHEEEENEEPETPHWTPEAIEKEIGQLSQEKQKEWLIRKLIYFQNEYMRCHDASESNEQYIQENYSLRKQLEELRIENGKLNMEILMYAKYGIRPKCEERPLTPEEIKQLPIKNFTVKLGGSEMTNKEIKIGDLVLQIKETKENGNG